MYRNVKKLPFLPLRSSPSYTTVHVPTDTNERRIRVALELERPRIYPLPALIQLMHYPHTVYIYPELSPAKPLKN